MDKSLIYAPNKPKSSVAFKVADKQMRAYWSADGKRPMPELLHFLSIVKNQFEDKARPHLSMLKKNYKWQDINGKEVMEIATLKQILIDDVIPYTHLLPKGPATTLRNGIIATFTAFENGDTSMINDVRDAVINTLNRQAAITVASVSDAQTVADASSVAGASSMSKEDCMLAINLSSGIYKVRASMYAAGAPSVSNGASVSSAPSALIKATNKEASDETSRINADLASTLCKLSEVNSNTPSVSMNATDEQTPVDKVISSRSSSSSSAFSTASVADSVDKALDGLGIDSDNEAPASDNDTSGDMAMLEAVDESEMQESSNGAALSAPMQQVCHLFIINTLCLLSFFEMHFFYFIQSTNIDKEKQAPTIDKQDMLMFEPFELVRAALSPPLEQVCDLFFSKFEKTSFGHVRISSHDENATFRFCQIRKVAFSIHIVFDMYRKRNF